MNEHDRASATKLRSLAGLATPMALRVAVTLGLPDRLRGTGATAGQLAGELGVSPIALRLLLDHLVTLEVLEHQSAGSDAEPAVTGDHPSDATAHGVADASAPSASPRYRTTGYGSVLCADAGNGLANFLDLDSAGGRADMAFVELRHTITTGQAGYAQHYGQDFWADLEERPHLRATFDQQMTHRFRAQLPDFVAGFDWGRFGSVVDVGGGHGTLLAAILEAHPGVRGHLVDLAPTAAGAERTFRERGLGDRVRVSAGSFFDPLPAAADAYLLVDILHDWDDEQAHRILARCAEAARPDSRVLVVEAVGGRKADTEFDLAMLAIFGGRDRRVEEFQELGMAHGLVLDGLLDVTEQRCLLEFRSAAIP